MAKWASAKIGPHHRGEHVQMIAGRVVAACRRQLAQMAAGGALSVLGDIRMLALAERRVGAGSVTGRGRAVTLPDVQ